MTFKQIYNLIRDLEELANELKWAERDDLGIIDQWQGGRERARSAKEKLSTTKFINLKAKAEQLLG